MMHVCFAWELGGKGGHLARWRVISQALASRGHRVTSILRDVGSDGAGDLVDLPTPVGGDPAWERLRVRSFADVLLKTAWRPGLAERVAAWRRLLGRLSPDVLVADYAPTALLAGRGFGVRSVTIGTGFSRCPRSGWLTDLPKMAGLSLPNDPQTRPRAAEALRRVNAASDAPPLEGLADLFDGVADIRCGFEALDPYGPADGSADERHWIGTLPPPSFSAPVWPDGGGKRLLVYAGSGPVIRSATGILANDGYRVIDLGALDRPVHVPTAVRQTDLVICGGSYGLVAESLLAGVPLMLLPRDIEKGLIAARVVQLGAGRIFNPQDSAQIVGGVAPMLAGAAFRQATEGFAADHRGHDAQQSLATACDMVVSPCDTSGSCTAV